MTDTTTARRDELLTRLSAVHERIDVACRACDRRDTPTVVVVTKFFPVSDLITLADAGVRDVGENREQDLVLKVDHLREHRPDLAERTQVHFIGQLQSKKAKRVGTYADVVHSLDRAKLVAPLSAAAQERGRSLDVFIQVSLDERNDARGGVVPAELAALADEVAAQQGLTLRGLMAVAPLDVPSRQAFDRLDRIRETFLTRHPDATWLSAGMTGDLEDAVAIGATHLRVGSAILGSRPAAG